MNTPIQTWIGPSDGPMVIAHRGARNEAPENTAEAIEVALSLRGISGVEFDVELSDIPVVLHQETMVPNDSGTSIIPAERDFVSRDWVDSLPSSTITSLDAGSYFHPSYAHVRVPTLARVLALQWTDVTAYVELKDPTYWGARDPNRPRRVAEATADLLRAFSGALSLISFNPAILKEALCRLPGLHCNLALWTEWTGRHIEAVITAKAAGASTILVPYSLVLEDPSWVAIAHDRGVTIGAYPVSPARGELEYDHYTPSRQLDSWERLARMGVDAIISDFPRETLTFFRGTR